jgi:ABC-type transport system involved in cytochrome c biogenesis permease subunit
MIGLIVILVAGAATFFGFRETRRFVRRRLRYVDAIHRMRAPWIAGTAATLLAAPVAWALPVIGAGTALLFGIGVGTGFAAGARDTSRGYKQLPRD